MDGQYTPGMHPGPLLPGMDDEPETAGPSPDTVPRAEGSRLLWEAGANALLSFAAGMGLDRSAFESAMSSYNAGIEGEALYKPFDTLEEFVTDPGVRKALAQAYNDKRSGRCATWEEARSTAKLAPAKHRMRSLSEALRARIALDTATLVTDDPHGEFRRRKPR